MNSIYKYSIILFALFFFISCDDDDPTIENPEELITTLRLSLTPVGGGTPVQFIFQDLDGDGGQAPTITQENLQANTTYNAELTLSDESSNPVEDITSEIKDEDEDHQFFFEVMNANLAVSYLDMDANLDPIGLQTEMVSGSTSSGTLKIVLRHEPDKSAAGVSAGNIQNAGGESDIEVVFNIEIN